METITLGQLMEAVGGRLLDGYDRLDTPISQVETDSRSIHPGTLFLPLVGDRFDGHAYIGAALEGGAIGCVTAREVENRRPTVISNSSAYVTNEKQKTSAGIL